MSYILQHIAGVARRRIASGFTTIYEHPSLVTGLVSAYNLRTNTYDYHNIYDGTNNGATQTGSGSGFFDEYYDFDGTNDYIDLGSRDYSGDFSISTCVSIDNDASASEQVFISNYNSAGNRCQYQIKYLASIDKIYYNTNTSGTQEQEEYTYAFTAGTRYHIVTTVSGNTLTLYINGVSQGTKTLNARPTSGFGNTSLGRAGDFNGLYLDGEIYQTLIYNKVLTSDEVTDLYNGGSGLPLGTPATMQEHGSLTTSLIQYYKLDEASGNAVDATGTYDLTLTGTVSAQTGALNGARGAYPTDNNNYFLTTSGPSYATANTYTFAAWMYVTSSFSGDQGIVSTGGGSGVYTFRMYANGTTGKVACYLEKGEISSTRTDSTTTWATTTWYSVICTVTPSTLYVYLNNAGDNSTTNTQGSLTSTTSYAIGGMRYTAAGNQVVGKFANGYVDENPVWNKQLTAGERTVWHNSGTPLAYN